jgi:hypothetical protein
METLAPGIAEPLTATDEFVVVNPETGDVIIGGMGTTVTLTPALAALVTPPRACVAVSE